MKKIILSFFIVLLLLSCSGKNIENSYPEFVGQWKSDDSMLSISADGKVHYFFKSGGMTGNAVIVNDNKIVVMVIIVPKVFKITKKMEKSAKPLTIDIDGKTFIKISEEPYRGIAERFKK